MQSQMDALKTARVIVCETNDVGLIYMYMNSSSIHALLALCRNLAWLVHVPAGLEFLKTGQAKWTILDDGCGE
jgi:hypothetical protein